ncbi:MAG: hypothetical protein MK095_05350 [Phycisphaerales bacterium]|nr:hypothetical protein [Phycisphaerales bacterium]
MQALKLLYIIILAIIGAVCGALLLGGFAIWLSIPGALVGLVVGALLGKYIPLWEWFT